MRCWPSLVFIRIRFNTIASSIQKPLKEIKQERKGEGRRRRRWRSCRDPPWPSGGQARRGWCGTNGSSPTTRPPAAASWGGRRPSDPPPIAAGAAKGAGRRSAPARCRRPPTRRRRTSADATCSAGSSARPGTATDRSRGDAELGNKEQERVAFCAKYV